MVPCKEFSPFGSMIPLDLVLPLIGCSTLTLPDPKHCQYSSLISSAKGRDLVKHLHSTHVPLELLTVPRMIQEKSSQEFFFSLLSFLFFAGMNQFNQQDVFW